MICELVANSFLKVGDDMARYNTRQRDVLLAFLNEHVHQPLSAQQIAQGLKGEKISISAVYRNLADLEREGKVRRLTQSGAHAVAYQFVDADACRGHIHLACKSCGKTFHLEDAFTAKMLGHFRERIEFSIDPADTVIYGLCKYCRQI